MDENKKRKVYAPLHIDNESNGEDYQYNFGKYIRTIRGKWYKYILYTALIFGLIAYVINQYYFVKDRSIFDGFKSDGSALNQFAPYIALGILGITGLYCLLACFCKIKLYQYGMIIQKFGIKKAICYNDIKQISFDEEVEQNNLQRHNAVWIPKFLRTTYIYTIIESDNKQTIVKSSIFFRLKKRMEDLQQNIVNE